MDTQRKKHVAVAIFVYNEGNIACQERGSYSKAGEKLGFWGGSIMPGEKKEDAIVRELYEELGYNPTEMEFWSRNEYEVDDIERLMGLKIIQEVFLSPITDELISCKVSEGSDMIILPIEEAYTHDGFCKGDRGILVKLRKHLRS